LELEEEGSGSAVLMTPAHLHYSSEKKGYLDTPLMNMAVLQVTNNNICVRESKEIVLNP
tara:strand:+ start:298 stop:474 length:177 start_codon:yes stop_codon:yes gene_type:complete